MGIIMDTCSPEGIYDACDGLSTFSDRLLVVPDTAFQVANSMFSAPYYSIVPELVPLHQRGSAGSWIAFLSAVRSQSTLMY